MVKRLADYKWSSYRTYAYAEPCPDWLEIDMILSQVSGDDRHVAYRRKVQGYSGEEKKMSEEIHLGLVAGTKKFAKYIKKKYMPDNPSEEIPQQKTVQDDFQILNLLEQACEILECDIEEFKNARRISYGNKLNRDIIIYLLWKTGAYTNKEIGAHFGLGYSAVSRYVSHCNELCNTSKDFEKRI